MATSGCEAGIPRDEERVILERRVWSRIADIARREFNERLKAAKVRTGRWHSGTNLVERLLGRELCVLAWAAERASDEELPVIGSKWAALRPEERWWLFTMTVAEAGLPDDHQRGWRRALHLALADGEVTRTRNVADGRWNKTSSIFRSSRKSNEPIRRRRRSQRSSLRAQGCPCAHRTSPPGAEALGRGVQGADGRKFMGKTLTALGSYWKGRKPLVLAKACVLGALLPATKTPKRDLEIFEMLMGNGRSLLRGSQPNAGRSRKRSSRR